MTTPIFYGLLRVSAAAAPTLLSSLQLSLPDPTPSSHYDVIGVSLYLEQRAQSPTPNKQKIINK